MSTERPLTLPTRQALLKDLASFASSSFVAQAAEISTDAQIATDIAGAKAQLEYRRRAGIRNLREAKA